MLTVVLGGGANYCAMQAGALEALLEAGLEPECYFGSSAGALNAIHMASQPSPQGARDLGRFWREVTPRDVGRIHWFSAARRILARSESLLDSQPLVRMLLGRFPEGLRTFGDLAQRSGVPAYSLAVNMETDEHVAFGDNPDDLLLDGAMASVAIPPFYPPWSVNGDRFVDGGIVSVLPIQAAIERGATRILAINLRNDPSGLRRRRGLFGVTSYALSVMLQRQVEIELEMASDGEVDLYLLDLDAPPDVPFWDYQQANVLIAAGRLQAQAKLAAAPFDF